MEKIQDDFEEETTKVEYDTSIIKKKSMSTKTTHSNSIADQNYDEVEEMKVMTKSEGLICDENLLLIWGTKFPKEKVEADKVIHHTLIQIDSLAKTGNFRIIYFHSDVKGKGNRIPKMIKTIAGNMSKSMRSKLKSFDIVHPNFSLKVALFFSMSTNTIVINKTKIHYVDCLETLYEKLEPDQKTFIMTTLPVDVSMFDSQLTPGGSYVDSSKKQFKKVIVSTSEMKYRNFDASTAEQTYDFMGKHIAEFKRAENDTVPEIFHVLFNYFEQNEEYIKKEGVFRLVGNNKLIAEIDSHVKEGEYDFLATVDDPLTVGVYLKKIFRDMGEPLCTFELYTKFKDINDENCKDVNEKIEVAQELLEELPPVNRDTFKALLNFLYMFTEYSEYNKMKSKNLAIVFAPNLFRAYEMTPNDMIYAQVLVKTLELMIDYCRD